MTEVWDGEERRGIPMHILNYMDDRLAGHTRHIEEILEHHTGEEMERYTAIVESIKAQTNASEARHSALIQSLNAYMIRQEDMRGAFLKNEDGHPDYHGHWYDHNHRKNLGIWWQGVKNGVLVKMIEWGSVLVVGWLGLMIWNGILQGPK